MLRLRRSQEGTAAIEYAIIGSLIGVGLIGSLIGTRGSLSAIFGTASSAMASSDAGTAAPQRTSTSPRASFWQAKTLSGSPVTQTSGSFQQTVYTYTDGSQVAILRDTAQNPTRVTVAQMLPDHQTFMSTTYSGATQIGRADMSFASPVSFSSTQVTSWTTPGPDQYQIPMPVGAVSALSQDRFTASSGFSNGTPTTVTTDNYNNGSWTGKSSGAPNSTYLSQNTTLGQDQQYFSDITP